MGCVRTTIFSCPEEYRRLNDPAQKREAVGPIIAMCLRARFIQFSGQVHLSPRCKDEVSSFKKSVL